MEIILIVVIIILGINNSNCNRRIAQLEMNERKLKKKIANLEKVGISNDITAEVKEVEQSEVVVTTTDTIEVNYDNGNVVTYKDEQAELSKQDTEEMRKQKEEEYRQRKIAESKRKDESRNTAILAGGAFFIVIAAVSFLYSTWEVLPNIFKSGVILVLVAVFFGLSYMAEKVFKLTKTSETFFYIAMLYIPIGLFSISLFELVGEYFSINGEGNFIYYTLCSALISVIYLFFAYKNDDKKLLFSSYFVQLIGVICLGKIFTSGVKEIVAIMLIYTMCINLFDGKKFVEERKQYLKILTYGLSTIGTICAILLEGTIAELVCAAAVMGNFVILSNKEKKLEYSVIVLVSSFVLLLSAINIKMLEFSFVLRQISVLMYVILSTYYYNFINSDKKLVEISNILNFIYTFGLTCITLNISSEEFIIPVYVLCGICIAMSTIVYIKGERKNIGLFITSIIFNYLILQIPKSIFSGVELENYIVLTVVTFALIAILHKDKNSFIKLVPIIGFLITVFNSSVIIGNAFDLNLAINAVLIVMFALLSIIDKEDYSYRAGSFLYLLGLFMKHDSLINPYVKILMFAVLTVIQYIFTKDDIKKVMKYLMAVTIACMYTYIFMDCADNYAMSYIITILIAIIGLKILEKDDVLKWIPMIGFMIPLYKWEVLINNTYDLTFLMNIILIVVFGYMAIKDKKDIMYRLLSFLYLIGLFIKYDSLINPYVKILMFAVLTVIQYIFTKDDIKKVMKYLMAVTIACMYTYIFMDCADNYAMSYIITILIAIIGLKILEKDDVLKWIPMIGFMIPLYKWEVLVNNTYDITFLMNITLIAVLGYMAIKDKKDIMYRLISFLYLIGFLMKYDELNEYVRYFAVMIWGGVQLLYTEGVTKEVMKILVETSVLCVYMACIKDMNINDITAVTLLGVMTYALAIIRGTIKKYVFDYKVIEYLTFVIIYILAFTMYNDGVDIAIFIALLVLTMMISYAKKYGPIFAVTMVAIVVNGFYLSREFWRSLPWWLYLVAVGGIMIAFAARNELKSKSNMEDMKEKVNRVREYLDM